MIPYDLSQLKIVIFDVDGVLSTETIVQHPDGEPMRTVNIKDGYAIQLAIKMGLQVAIITGGRAEATRKRYEALGITDIYMGCAVKIEAYDQLLEKYGLTDNQVLYMGDDIPDYEVMKRAGCPCAPADAAHEIKEISCYISHRIGGNGCVRDVLEQVMRVKGIWMMDKRAFGW